ncbi:MAG: HD domain-containing protein [Anaerolineales bacterium]|nr:HD domain-containing protein [Anaerolineales bacterium]MCB9004627.1 HD domain-containing protein [Ardenticatenaceae bacterium]
MIYHDDVYGAVTIDAPVILDLLESKAMQRLHGVLQHGVSALIGITSPVTRFEHSVGAMLLVQRLGASLPEQIAALLHDVSHTAFSHVIDYVFDGHDSQSFHDEQKEAYLAGTDIPAVLAKHGFDWHDFLHEADFPLLEQPSPRLCADRLDYFLRDAPGLGLATSADTTAVLTHLVVADGRIVTDDLDAARWLGYTFMKADDASWANFREVGLYELTAQAIRRGLAAGAITMDDIWGVDLPLWQKLQASPDAALQKWLTLITLQTEFVWDEAAPTFRVSTKLRAIDPDVWDGAGVIRPLSQLDPAFAQQRQQYLHSKQGKWPMKVREHEN